MIKWLIGGIAGSLAFALLWLAVMGIPPKPQKVISPSKFENLLSVGAAIYYRLNQDVNRSNVVVVGSSPFVRGYEKIWLGFVHSTEYHHRPFDKALELNGLSSLASEISVVNVDLPIQEQQWEELQKAIDRGQRILIHVTANLSSQWSLEALSKKVKARLGTVPLTLTQVPMVVREDQLSQLQPSCSDKDDFSQLTCKAVQVSKRNFRKQLPVDKWVATVEKFGANDYLVFVAAPQAQ